MHFQKADILSRIKSAFDREKTICRIIAAWCLYAAINLLTIKENFYELSFAQTTSTVVMILLILGFFVVMSVVSAIFPKLETDSYFLLLGATVCVIRWLAKYKSTTNSTDSTLFLLAVIFVYTLFIFYFLQRNHLIISKIKINSPTVWIITGVFGLIAGAVIAVITCLRYTTFSTPNFDFGLFVNMFHNMKETGLPLVSSERDVLLSHFAVHLSPIYYLILPFYAIFPSPLTLQIAQAIIVTSGIIPAVLIARHFKLSGRTQLFVALIYALYPATTMGCLYDIHENCFLLPLLLWMFYFFERQKYIPMYVFAFLTLFVKEDAAIYVLFFAIYILISRKKHLHGTILAIIAIAYFVGALIFLTKTSAYWAEFYAGDTPNPEISGPMINRFDNLIYEEDAGLAGAVLTALKNPGYLLTQIFSTQNTKIDSWFLEQSAWAKAAYILHMLLPLGMIPFCTRKYSRLLLIAPILLNILTTYKYQYNINFQYHFGITAFLIYAMIINLPDLKPLSRRKLLSFGAAACCCMYLFIALPRLNSIIDDWKDNKDEYIRIEEMLDTLPEDASLCVPSSYLAHVADRREVYDLSYHAPNSTVIKVDDVEYVVLRNGTDDKYSKIFRSKGYTVWAEYYDHTILQKPQK